MNTVTSSDDWPNKVEKNGGNPAVFCSDSTALLFTEIDGNKLPVAITDAWLVAVKSDKRRPNLLQI